MATLTLEDGTTLAELPAIQDQLAKLAVQLKHWPTGDDPRLTELLGKDALDAAEKDEVLSGLDHYFEQLKQSDGYQTRDLIVLHPGIPGLDGICAKFADCHTHDDDEVRYIVGGEGTFGFVLPGGEQVALTMAAGEYINVPKDTEHWFVLTDSKRIKAVRYFTSTEGWTPVYTGTPTRL